MRSQVRSRVKLSGRPFLMRGCTQTLWPFSEPALWCRESSWFSRNQANQEEILRRLTKSYLAPLLRATLKQLPTATTYSLFFQAQKHRGTAEIVCGVRSKHLAKIAQPSAENFPSKPFPPVGVDHSRLMARLPWHLLRQTFLHRINPFLFERPPSSLNTLPFASDLLLHIILFHSKLSQWHRHAVIQGCRHHRQHDSPCSLLC